jgi:hypothetical protein
MTLINEYGSFAAAMLLAIALPLLTEHIGGTK